MNEVNKENQENTETNSEAVQEKGFLQKAAKSISTFFMGTTTRKVATGAGVVAAVAASVHVAKGGSLNIFGSDSANENMDTVAAAALRSRR